MTDVQADPYLCKHPRSDRFLEINGNELYSIQVDQRLRC